MPLKTSNTEPSAPTSAQMSVRKRSGSLEPLDINKIIRAVSRCAEGIPDVDPNRVAVKTIGGLYDGASTQELDALSIQTAASFIPDNPNYSRLAAALLAEVIRKEVAGQGIESFSQSFLNIHRLGLALDQGIGIVQANKHCRAPDHSPAPRVPPVDSSLHRQRSKAS